MCLEVSVAVSTVMSRQVSDSRKISSARKRVHRYSRGQGLGVMAEGSRVGVQELGVQGKGCDAKMLALPCFLWKGVLFGYVGQNSILKDPHPLT